MIFDITVQVVLEHHRPHSYKMANLIRAVGFPGTGLKKKKICLQCRSSLGWEDPLDEVMVTHPSILAWRIPADRSLANYNPRVQRVRHDWSDLACPCVLTAPLIRSSFVPLPLLGPSYSLKNSNVEIRPIYTLQLPLSIKVKGRVTHLSF